MALMPQREQKILMVGVNGEGEDTSAAHSGGYEYFFLSLLLTRTVDWWHHINDTFQKNSFQFHFISIYSPQFSTIAK
jgi:hypothetical protein